MLRRHVPRATSRSVALYRKSYDVDHTGAREAQIDVVSAESKI